MNTLAATNRRFLNRLSLAHSVRLAAEQHYGSAMPRAFLHQCGPVSAALVITLRQHGISAHPIHGYYVTKRSKRGHFWVASGRHYYDLTASQFSHRNEAVRVVPKTDKRYEVDPTDWRHVTEVQLMEVMIKRGERDGLLADAFMIVKRVEVAERRETECNIG